MVEVSDGWSYANLILQETLQLFRKKTIIHFSYFKNQACLPFKNNLVLYCLKIMSVHLTSNSIYSCLSVHQNSCLSVHQNVYLSICLYICLSARISVYPKCVSVYLLVYLSILYICLSKMCIYLSACISVYQKYVSVYLSIKITFFL